MASSDKTPVDKKPALPLSFALPDTSGPNWDEPESWDVQEGAEIAKILDIDPVVGICISRVIPGGVAPETIYRPALADIKRPKDTLKSLPGACRRLAQAVLDGEQIAIFADYDPDGTCSSSLLRRTLNDLAACPQCAADGCADCQQGRIMPEPILGHAQADRGFGLDPAFVEEAAEQGAKLLVTLDCGSGQSRTVARAQELGMQVIVVDHHEVDVKNPCDHHINPLLPGEIKCAHTGAPLTWKLAAGTWGLVRHLQGALQADPAAAWTDLLSDEVTGPALYLGAFGCRADRGALLDLDNRAMLKNAFCENGRPPLGLVVLAEMLDEDPLDIQSAILTSAALNTPKRTTRLSAQLVSDLLTTDDPQTAQDLAQRVAAVYSEAQKIRAQENAKAEKQTEHPDPRIGKRSSSAQERVHVAVLDDEPEWSGYSGAIAQTLTGRLSKPTLIFMRRPKGDADGKPLYKFSMRSSRGKLHMLGEHLIGDEALKAACQVKTAEGMTTNLGGHAQVVSGACTEENIAAAVKAVDDWAKRLAAKGKFHPKAWNGAEATIAARCVDSQRLQMAHRQAKQMAPFSWADGLKEPNVTIKGVWVPTERESEDELLRGVVRMDDGYELPVLISSRAPYPLPDPGGEAEWVIPLDGRSPSFLRYWHLTNSSA